MKTLLLIPISSNKKSAGLCIKSLNLLFFILFISVSIHEEGLAQCTPLAGTEAIINGSFEGSDINFTLGTSPEHYTLLPVGKWSNPGTYQIENNDYDGSGKSTYNTPVFDGVFDHTSPEKHGNMLMVDPSEKDAIVYQTTANILPNQIYYFSAWITELGNTGNNAIVQLEIELADGSVIPLGTNVSTTYKVWKQTYATWNSDTNTTVTIRIRDRQPVICCGNDLGLDDISFINSCNNIVDHKPDLGSPQSICSDGLVILDSKLPPTVQTWWYNTLTGNDLEGTFSGGKGQGIVSVDKPGLFSVCTVSDIFPNCPIVSKVEVLKTIISDLGPDLPLCSATSVILDSKSSGSKLIYQWTKNEQIIPGANRDTLVVTSPGLYKIAISSSVPGCGTVFNDNNVSNKLPVPLPGVFCKDNAAFHVQPSGGSYKWYKTNTSTETLGTGSFVIVPLDQFSIAPTDTTITLFVEDTTLTRYSTGASSKTSKTYFVTGAPAKYLMFNALKPFYLDSVHIRVNFYTSLKMSGSITVLDLNGAVIKTIPVRIIKSLPMGLSTDSTVAISIGMFFQKGNGYKLILNNEPQSGDDPIQALYTPYDQNFLYTVPGILSIRPIEQFNLDYYFFYDWKISVPSECGRVPVTLNLERDCIVTSTQKSESDKETFLFPNPFSEELNYSLAAEKFTGVYLQICTAQGLVLSSESLEKAEGRVKTDHLPKGVYLFKIINEKEVIVKKVIKN